MPPSDELRPSRGNLLVRPVQTAESFAGSKLVLLEETRQRWTGMQCEVVAVGEPERCEDEDCERYHYHVVGNDAVHNCLVEVGDWLLVRPRCFVPTDVDNVWVCKQSDALARLTVIEEGRPPTPERF